MEKVPTLGDTPEHVWMLEFFDRCFPESGGRVNADLQLAMAMCKAEPKCAQVAMQWLAQEIRSGLHGEPETVFLRFALGVLYTAYVGLAQAEGRCSATGLPAELELPVRWNPEIIACANELGPIKAGGDG
jgi:hypothetical protein